MLHLKKFEGFKDLHYWEVQPSDYHMANQVEGEWYSTGVPIEQRFLKKLKEWFPEHSHLNDLFYIESKQITLTVDTPVSLAVGYGNTCTAYSGSGPFVDIWITQETDEYFWVMFSMYSQPKTTDYKIYHRKLTAIQYYKCDQFEGLVKLLNDSGILTKS